jgi:hypothetical protein
MLPGGMFPTIITGGRFVDMSPYKLSVSPEIACSLNLGDYVQGVIRSQKMAMRLCCLLSSLKHGLRS